MDEGRYIEGVGFVYEVAGFSRRKILRPGDPDSSIYPDNIVCISPCCGVGIYSKI